jgi:hypothetical protein
VLCTGANQGGRCDTKRFLFSSLQSEPIYMEAASPVSVLMILEKDSVFGVGVKDVRASDKYLSGIINSDVEVSRASDTGTASSGGSCSGSTVSDRVPPPVRLCHVRSTLMAAAPNGVL